MAPTLLASTALGDVVVSDGVVYFLTTCCGASYKGAGDGIVCRACYANREDDPAAGWGSLARELEATAYQLGRLLGPSLEHHAVEWAYKLAARAAAITADAQLAELAAAMRG